MKLQDKLQYCHENKKALLATNFYNYETLRGVLEAAKRTNSPLILQLTKSSIEYMGLENAVSMGRTGLKTFGIEGWIHLDHCDSVDLIKNCLDAGFDSVMFDGSEMEIEKNIELTNQVVKLAKTYDANVEAELGYVAKLGQSTEKMEYTKTEDAKQFVDATGINALAVAIGTAHGFYKSEPKLDFNRLSEINAVTNAALVLHGGSGVPSESITKAVSLGICKVNLATEIKNIFTKSLQSLLRDSNEIDIRKVFPPAINAITDLVAAKLRLMNP
jgi:fructose-bisphosphate aldolase class II/tagatose 1,6-diphosphate aldolase GatY/KbaY